MVFEPLAVGEAVLTPDEKRARRAAGRRRRRHHRVRPLRRGRASTLRPPIGAGHFTNDLAMVLRTPFAEAEKIKVKQGCCLPAWSTATTASRCRRSAAAPPASCQARAVRDPAAAGRRAVHAAARGLSRKRLGRQPARRHRAHRRRRPARRVCWSSPSRSSTRACATACRRGSAAWSTCSAAPDVGDRLRLLLYGARSRRASKVDAAGGLQPASAEDDGQLAKRLFSDLL
jgi:hypothetical protein